MIRAVLGLLLALVLVGCSATAPEETAQPPQIPATPVGEVATWVFDQLQGDDDVETAEWEERLHETFLAEVPASELTALLNEQIRPARPFTLTHYQGSETNAVLTLDASIGDPIDLSISIDETGEIMGLFFAPAAEPRDPASSLGEIEERLDDLEGTVSALVVRDGETLIDRNADDAAPLGSVFKLYVLGAVSQAVKDGRLAWDDVLVVDDTVRSLPSGELQDEPDGTEVTVGDAARGMIAISDNTATDMLIRAVGREAVEQTVSEFGHHDPAAMRPFPTTRDLFRLLWEADDETAAQWESGDEAERRAIVQEWETTPLTLDVSDITPTQLSTPGWDRGADWFATAHDIEAALLALDDDTDPRVQEILGVNPGVAIDEDVWSRVAFKGGSAPGVLAGAWYAQDDDGGSLVVVLLARDATAALDQTAFFGIAEDLFVVAR